jgi:hypothetical protein
VAAAQSNGNQYFAKNILVPVFGIRMAAHRPHCQI